MEYRQIAIKRIVVLIIMEIIVGMIMTKVVIVGASTRPEPLPEGGQPETSARQARNRALGFITITWGLGDAF